VLATGDLAGVPRYAAARPDNGGGSFCCRSWRHGLLRRVRRDRADEDQSPLMTVWTDPWLDRWHWLCVRVLACASYTPLSRRSRSVQPVLLRHRRRDDSDLLSHTATDGPSGTRRAPLASTAFAFVTMPWKYPPGRGRPEMRMVLWSKPRPSHSYAPASSGRPATTGRRHGVIS
jgi:hypothetical protein